MPPRKKKPSLADLHTELQQAEPSAETPVTGEIIPASVSALSEEISDEERLKQLETIIDLNLKAFYEVGLALKEVRDRELYKLQSFITFEDYCVQRWEMHRANAYRLIDSSVVMTNLSPMGDKLLPANERQVRPLTKLPPEQQQEVWEKVIESAPVVDDKPKVTAKLVEEVVSQVLGKEETESESSNQKSTYRLSLDEETSDALSEVFHKIRRLVDKEHKGKVTKELVAIAMLQVALLEKNEDQEAAIMTKMLESVKN